MYGMYLGGNFEEIDYVKNKHTSRWDFFSVTKYYVSNQYVYSENHYVFANLSFERIFLI